MGRPWASHGGDDGGIVFPGKFQLKCTLKNKIIDTGNAPGRDCCNSRGGSFRMSRNSREGSFKIGRELPAGIVRDGHELPGGIVREGRKLPGGIVRECCVYPFYASVCYFLTIWELPGGIVRGGRELPGETVTGGLRTPVGDRSRWF